MSRFTQREEPLGRFLFDGKHFKLEESICYEVGGLGSGEPINIPIGFVTDFASIPRAVWPIISQNLGRRAAIVHDWLYATKGLNGKYSREKCDKIFLEALGILEVNWAARHIMYLAVRAFGWSVWKKIKQPIINDNERNT